MRKVDPTLIDKIVKLYVKEKKSLYQIGCDINKSTVFITKILKNAMVTIRPPSRHFDKEAIINEYKSGAKCLDLMDKYHISKSGLWLLVRGLSKKPKQKKKEKEIMPKKERPGGVNVYRTKDGSFYYSESPRDYDDVKIENSISPDYAFDMVGKLNKN